MNTKTKTAKKAATKKAAPVKATGGKSAAKPAKFRDVAGDRQNGVKNPRPGSQARMLWDVCETLQKSLGRPPARFEFREAIANKSVNGDAASFQYFAWRKFHGIPGRSLGIYPKRNSYEVNTAAPVATKTARTPAARKSAANKPKPAPAVKVAKKAAKPAKAAKVAKKAPAKKNAVEKGLALGKPSKSTPASGKRTKVAPATTKPAAAAPAAPKGVRYVPPGKLAKQAAAAAVKGEPGVTVTQPGAAK